ncbi:MAG: hypothetical protein QXH40_03770 [Candidatus Bathyarchaeia archaeon]
MISEEEAIQLIKNTSKCAHALLVSAIMAEMAEELSKERNQSLMFIRQKLW